MSDKVFDPNNVDLSAFQLFEARNGQLDLNVVAVRVTIKNIGAMSLAFDAELHRRRDDMMPYFGFKTKRDDSQGYRYVEFLVGDVLAVVRGEIRRFDKEIFNNTFTSSELIEYRCSVCGKISGDNQVGEYGEMHPNTEVLLHALVPGKAPLITKLVPCNMLLVV